MEATFIFYKALLVEKFSELRVLLAKVEYSEWSLDRQIEQFWAQQMFEDTYSRLMTWRWEARPFLWVNQCAYYQALVRETIRAYRSVFVLGIGNGMELLEELYLLLDEDPPPYDPDPDPAINAGSLFCHLKCSVS